MPAGYFLSTIISREALRVKIETVIYLDYAAATPMDDRVLAAMLPYFQDKYFNPSAAYLLARSVSNDFESARHRLAQVIGARPGEIILTAGATESINLALNGVEGRIVTTQIEHQSVLAVANSKQATILPVGRDGRLDLEAVSRAIDDDVSLLSVGYVNSEIGVIQDISALAQLVNQIRQDRLGRGVTMPLYLHSDASQGAGLLDINVARLGVDMLTLNAAKCYGPKQVGLLYVRAGIKLKPLIQGGGQEMGLRSGTENVAGVIGFALALELADKLRHHESKRLRALNQQLKAYLSANLKDVSFNSISKVSSPAILNFSVDGIDGERVLFALDERGVMVATGSACAANQGRRSHVLIAIGLTNQQADGSIRVSIGRFTTEEEIATAGQLIVDAINQQRKFGGMKVVA